MSSIVLTLVAIATVFAHWAEAEPCTPGETKMNDCNHCFCLPDGTGYACTLMGCIHDTIIPTDVPAIKVCEPGHVTMKECNTCFCNSDGTAYACTRKACPIEELTCEPGTNFKNRCNTCRCGNDGLRRSAACTRAACPEDVAIEQGNLLNSNGEAADSINREKRQADNNGDSCVPGETKMIDCNSCRCVTKPPGWACTKIGCPKSNHHDH